MQRRRGQREVAIKVGGIAEADVAVVAKIERLAFDVRDEARRRGPQDFVGRGYLARQGEGIVAPAEGAIDHGGAVEGWRGDREIDAGGCLDGIGAQVGIENGAARDAHIAECEFLQRGGPSFGERSRSIRDDAGIGCRLGKADFCLLRECGGKFPTLAAAGIDLETEHGLFEAHILHFNFALQEWHERDAGGEALDGDQRRGRHAGRCGQRHVRHADAERRVERERCRALNDEIAARLILDALHDLVANEISRSGDVEGGGSGAGKPHHHQQNDGQDLQDA